MKKFQLSLVIPAYNEGERIGRTLETIESYLHAKDISCEVIVVLDGSSDATGDVVRDFTERSGPATFRLIHLPTNMGKGAAVKRGVEEATGEIVGFTDADLPYGMDPVEAALESLREESPFDIVIGGRDLPGSSFPNGLPPARKVAGRVYSVLGQIFLNTRIPDTQCGLKFFRQGIAKKIFSKATINGFGFDLEIIHIAQVNGFRIKRIPVTLKSSEGSTVRLVRDSCRMFLELFLIRIGDIRHRYELDSDRSIIPGDYQERALKGGHPIQCAWNRNRLRLLDHVLQFEPSDIVLDAGSGSAIIFRKAADRGAKAFGVDTNFDAVAFAAKRHGASGSHFVNADVCRLPILSDRVTKIIFQEVIEHLKTEDIRRCLQEFRRVLATNGLIFLTTPNHWSLWPLMEFVLDTFRLTPPMGGEQHLSTFSRNRLRTVLEEYGFEVVQLGAFNFLSPIAAWISPRLASRLFNLELAFPGLPGNLLYCLARRKAGPKSRTPAEHANQ